MVKNHLTLQDADREHLQRLVRQENLPVKVYRRAQALLLLDAGTTLQHAAATVQVTTVSVAAWRDRYQEQGLELLEDAPRAGRPIRIDGVQRAHITALACSTPPVGYARWSLRLLADQAVELGYVDAISHEGVASILKKTSCSPTARRPGA